MMIIQIATLILLIILVSSLLFFLLAWRWLVKFAVKKFGTIIMTDSYQENLLEMIPGFTHVGVQNVFENNLRAETGDVLHRPLAGPYSWPNADTLTFIPAQIADFPVDMNEDVDVRVTIGPKAKKPLEIEIPLIISAMAYPLALSEQSRMALAKAAKQVNTAINTGEGVVLPEELDLKGKLILQFSKTTWAKEDHLYKQAAMIEIKFGQGAKGGMGTKIKPDSLTGRARELMGLKENEVAEIYEHFFENQTIDDLKDLVTELRNISGGVPIGAKIAAGGKLEEDIDGLLYMGVDFISIDGGQGSTHGSPAVLSEGFGIPTLHALVRAVNYLEKKKVRDQVSLIISGGISTPIDYLRALALGADAVYIGSTILFALAHKQTLKAVPFEPPTQAIFHGGKFAEQFNIDEGAKAAENYLKSSTEEIKLAIRAIGKYSLEEVTIKDLVSFDENVAKKLGVPYTFDPWNKKKTEDINKGEDSQETGN